MRISNTIACLVLSTSIKSSSVPISDILSSFPQAERPAKGRFSYHPTPCCGTDHFQNHHLMHSSQLGDISVFPKKGTEIISEHCKKVCIRANIGDEEIPLQVSEFFAFTEGRTSEWP